MSRSQLVPGKPLSRAQVERGVDGIDWERWRPTVRATLGFVLQADRILLIRKKRGLGAGKITGPGGKLDPGETPLASAIRELREELGITTLGTRQGGEFCAQFVDGLAMHVSVFAADRYAGRIRESEEAEPHWFDIHSIPYERMWPDNVVWLPELIAGRRFVSHFVLDYERLFDSELLR